MLRRLLRTLFKGRSVHVPGTSALQDGYARTVTLGDLGAGGSQILLCRLAGKLHALDSLCPHQQGRIQAGPLVEGRYVRCPVHNYLFDPVNGAVVSGVCRKATVYRVDEQPDGCLLFI
jgi:nitrite reductase/ring-hydroxylating ferredoxin subunit